MALSFIHVLIGGQSYRQIWCMRQSGDFPFLAHAVHSILAGRNAGKNEGINTGKNTAGHLGGTGG